MVQKRRREMVQNWQITLFIAACFVVFGTGPSEWHVILLVASLLAPAFVAAAQDTIRERTSR